MSETSSSNDSVAEKFSDLQVETGGLSPNKIPTPSPTGSSSTLSDDQPLEKNGVNLVGSETDSGVVSLNEARLTDEQAGEDENVIGDVLRGEPDGGCDGPPEKQSIVDPLNAQELTDALNAAQPVDATPSSHPRKDVSHRDKGESTTTRVPSLSSQRQIAKSHLTLPVASQSQAAASCTECGKLQVPDAGILRPRAMSPLPGPLNPQIMDAIHRRRDAVDQACDRGGDGVEQGGPSGPPLGYVEPSVDSDQEVSDAARAQKKKKIWYFKPLELSDTEEGRGMSRCKLFHFLFYSNRCGVFFLLSKVINLNSIFFSLSKF